MSLKQQPQAGLTSIYHEALGFPKGVRLPSVIQVRGLTAHAKQRVHERGLSSFFPKTLNLKSGLADGTVKLIELRMSGVNIERILVRVRLEDFWLCLSVNLTGTVFTAYVNQFGDEHGTLDRTRYTVPA